MPRMHPNRPRGNAREPGERTPETARNMARIVELRRQRIGFPEIAQTLNVSTQYTRRLYRQALADIPTQHVDEHRAEELVLYDDAIADLMIIAREQKVSPRTRIEAWNSIRGYAERKAKLLGLDAPTQVVTIDKVDQEIAALERELQAMEASVDAAAGAESVAELAGTEG